MLTGDFGHNILDLADGLGIINQQFVKLLAEGKFTLVRNTHLHSTNGLFIDLLIDKKAISSYLKIVHLERQTKVHL